MRPTSCPGSRPGFSNSTAKERPTAGREQREVVQAFLKAARDGDFEALLRVLSVDGVVTRSGQGWESTGRPWTFDAAKYATLRRARDAEADLMRR